MSSTWANDRATSVLASPGNPRSDAVARSPIRISSTPPVCDDRALDLIEHLSQRSATCSTAGCSPATRRPLQVVEDDLRSLTEIPRSRASCGGRSGWMRSGDRRTSPCGPALAPSAPPALGHSAASFAHAGASRWWVSPKLAIASCSIRWSEAPPACRRADPTGPRGRGGIPVSAAASLPRTRSPRPDQPSHVIARLQLGLHRLEGPPPDPASPGRLRTLEPPARRARSAGAAPPRRAGGDHNRPGTRAASRRDRGAGRVPSSRSISA